MKAFFSRSDIATFVSPMRGAAVASPLAVRRRARAASAVRLVMLSIPPTTTRSEQGGGCGKGGATRNEQIYAK